MTFIIIINTFLNSDLHSSINLIACLALLLYYWSMLILHYICILKILSHTSWNRKSYIKFFLKIYHKILFDISIKSGRDSKIAFDNYKYWISFISVWKIKKDEPHFLFSKVLWRFWIYFANILPNKFLAIIVIIFIFSDKYSWNKANKHLINIFLSCIHSKSNWWNWCCL